MTYLYVPFTTVTWACDMKINVKKTDVIHVSCKRTS